ncbi:MAG: glutathione S-transferase N-terminal domain-containing protein [Brevundimonas sp.]|uniref:glutathione S-transferase N-terminal domain-containing protein n=1 Tax=Brevundimonas sp. TaxID=1871086 RepID=UPI002733A6A5|nr:glutathione S-transferase N-terminal domain-containing protein [Brevundimonas sp.]MDP3377657.1 glutathione S-transferase N-terminal domain-containing protein [Brevundimonas sp.]
MKLYISTPSPYARLCRIVARERGLADRIEEVVADPYADDPGLMASNPLVQVPALITGDGLPLTDSPVICEWLDAHGTTGPRLLPPEGPERWRVRRLQTLAHGALEMGVKRLLERRRPESEQSPSWIDRWTRNMHRSFDALEQALPDDDALDLGTIASAVATTWTGFRHPDIDWAANCPRLVALTERLEARDSFFDTRPA